MKNKLTFSNNSQQLTTRRRSVSAYIRQVNFWSYVTPHFRKKLRDHVLAVPGNMQVKFDVCSYTVKETGDREHQNSVKIRTIIM